MSRATLKKYLGEGGAGMDDSSGVSSSRMIDVLQSLANAGEAIGYSQASPTTGIKGALVCDSPTRLANVYVRAGVAGTAGTSSFKVNVNGVQKAIVSIAHDEADGTAKGLAINLPLEAGDLVELEVSAVATGATGLAATVRLKPVTVEV